MNSNKVIRLMNILFQGIIMTPLERITQLVNINGEVNNPDTPRPLLSLEDFFIDNNIHGSICCNVILEQSPQAIYHHFLKIRERNNVSDVLVEITMFDDPDWPFSESILVITTASPEEVQSWFVEEIAPDECWEGWSEDTEHGWVEVPVGMHPVTCWWD